MASVYLYSDWYWLHPLSVLYTYQLSFKIIRMLKSQNSHLLSVILSTQPDNCNCAFVPYTHAKISHHTNAITTITIQQSASKDGDKLQSYFDLFFILPAVESLIQHFFLCQYYYYYNIASSVTSSTMRKVNLMLYFLYELSMSPVGYEAAIERVLYLVFNKL